MSNYPPHPPEGGQGEDPLYATFSSMPLTCSANSLA